MKNSIVITFMLFFFCGCHHNRGRQEGKPFIVVSILPQKTFIEKIGGDDFEVSVLIPHGANPVTYSLLPAQMKEISIAKAWFRMGYVGFELSWGDRIRETNPRMKEIDLSEGLQLASGGDPGRERRGGTDPHTWLSPANVKIMSHRILDELLLFHPGKAEEYKMNHQRFLEEIESTDKEIKRILGNEPGRKFITYHPSFTYFARDYGLTQLSVEAGGKEPTPVRMVELAEIARKEGIRDIYIQSEFDLELAGIFAKEIDGRVIQVWPLNPDWSSNLLEIARSLSGN